MGEWVSGWEEGWRDGWMGCRDCQFLYGAPGLEDLLSVDPEAYQSSVWLGTEDGW